MLEAENRDLMERDRLPSKTEAVPQSAEVVLSVSAEVERQLRMLISCEAKQQVDARKKRIEAAKREKKEPAQEKKGWAEPLQNAIQTRITALMKEQGFGDEGWTLSTSIAAGILKDIVERGKVGKGDVPADYRKVVADFCRVKGRDPDATLRTIGLLWAGRLVGYSKPPTESELQPETMQFLAGLHYEFGEINEEKHIGVEGRARTTPKEAVAKMRSDHPVVQQAGFNAFDQYLDGWVSRPPPQEDARKEHFADVITAIGVATTTAQYTNLDSEKKRNLSLRMNGAQTRIARKTGKV